MKKDITQLADIKILVDSFYEEVRKDELLKDIFNKAIQDNWPQHLEKMYRFWQTVLLEQHTYYGSPFLPHAKLPIGEMHFERWLNLFNETVDRYFYGEKALEAKLRGKKMAQMFLSKIDYYNNTHKKPLK